MVVSSERLLDILSGTALMAPADPAAEDSRPATVAAEARPGPQVL